MKNAIKHITIYLLATIMLVFSTGFSVCCMFGCHNANVEIEGLSCCEMASLESSPDHQSSDCPNCNSEFISLDTDFLPTSSHFEIAFSPVTVCQPIILFSAKLAPRATIAPLEHDLPPPPYGKELLPLIQTFLC
ncbi:MAG: hypothetical protein AAFZ15_12140 [Bacteroidota bacterium]